MQTVSETLTKLFFMAFTTYRFCEYDIGVLLNWWMTSQSPKCKAIHDGNLIFVSRDLSNNNIATLPDSVFVELTSLEQL